MKSALPRIKPFLFNVVHRSIEGDLLCCNNKIEMSTPVKFGLTN